MVSFRYTRAQLRIWFLRNCVYPAPPSIRPKTEQDMIQKTLNAIGVTYSHMNDDILVPSRIEAERTKQTLIVRGLFLYWWKLIIFFLIRKLERGKVKGRRKEGMKRLQCSGHRRGSIINRHLGLLTSCVFQFWGPRIDWRDLKACFSSSSFGATWDDQ